MISLFLFSWNDYNCSRKEKSIMIHGKFIVPSYYKDFRCKGKDCRNCCCQGWKITLTQKEYFQLLDVDCSALLKEKILAYVGILPHPNEMEYARINFNYQGECPLRLDNGYCGLQVECGEEKIPSVCRYYPRAPHLYPKKECSISNSCEWVIEFLLEHEMSFEERELSFTFEEKEEKTCLVEQEEKRTEYLSILKKGKPLNECLIDIILSLKEDVSMIKKERHSYFLSELKKTFSHSASLMFLLENCVDRNISLAIEEEEWIKKILVNHLFYMRFPYLRKIENPGICLFYVVLFWKWILSCNKKTGTKEEFVDLSATFFRVGEHSNLYEVIDFLVKRNQF